MTFPAEDVDIVSFLDEINGTGISRVANVVLLNSEKESEIFLTGIDKE